MPSSLIDLARSRLADRTSTDYTPLPRHLHLSEDLFARHKEVLLTGHQCNVESETVLPFISTWGPPPRVVPHITVHRGSQCYRLAFWRCPTSRVARRPSVTCARCERCALPAFVAFDSWTWLQALRFSVGGRTVPCGRTVLWVTYGLLHDPITTPRLAFHVHMHMAAMRTCPGRTGTIRTATHVANQLHVRHATVGRAPLHGVP